MVIKDHFEQLLLSGASSVSFTLDVSDGAASTRPSLASSAGTQPLGQIRPQPVDTTLPISGTPVQIATPFPYTPYGVQRSFPYGLGGGFDSCQALRQETSIISSITENYSAKRKYSKILEEQAAAAWLATQQGEMSSRSYTLPVCSPVAKEGVCMDSIPQDLQALVSSLSSEFCWDPLGVLISILGAVGIAMRGRYCVQLDAHWNEAVLLYSFVVRSSGSKKSALLDMLKQPFNDFINAKATAYSNGQASKEQAQKLKRAALNKIKRKNENEILKHMSGANLWDFEQALPKFDELAAWVAQAEHSLAEDLGRAPRLFADKFTSKKLHAAMAEHGGGLAMLEAEGGSFANMLEQPTTHVDALLKGYNMESLIWDSGKDEVAIQFPHLNMLFLIQPAILHRIYKNQRLDGVGFLSRICPYFASQLPQSPEGTYPRNDEQVSLYNEKIVKMLERNYTQSAVRDIFTCTVSPEAYAYIKEFEHRAAAQGPVGGFCHELEGFMHKLHGTAVRFAATLHAWTHAEPEKESISLGEIQVGCAVAQALVSHAVYAFAPCGLGAYNDALKILDWIRRNRSHFFSSDQINKGVSSMTNVKTYAALDLLEQHNIIRQSKRPHHVRQCAVHLHFA